ncbi:MAG: pilus assembly protein PilM [Thermoguttaceae bacterium]
MPIEALGESMQQERGDVDASSSKHTDPDTTLSDNEADVEWSEADAGESEANPMQRDSARHAPQPNAAPPVVAAGGAITCPQCGMENVARAGRRFCGDCGTNLWEKCHGCGAEAPADERFCGQCGVNMADSMEQQIRNTEQHLARALRLEQEYRFSEAKVLLSSIVKMQRSGLKQYVEKAEERLSYVRLELDRWEHLAESAYKRAQEAVAICDFPEAVRILEEIPSPVRTMAIKALLLEAQARQKQIEELTAKLRTCVAEKRGGEVVPIVERLRRLQPNHALARKIAVQMRDHFAGRGEQKMAARRYDEAVELMQRIPPSAHTPQTEALLLEAAELGALSWHASQSPYVDDSLKEVLTRLLRRLPKDEAIAKLAAEYRKRSRLVAAPERTLPVPWASNSKSRWNCPVEWMVGTERIKMDEISPARRRSHPGAFSVAFGLALQGIDQGPVKIDFSDTNTGVMGRVARLMLEKRHDSAWGIDIGDHSLKVVKLHARDGGRRVEAVVCEAIEHRKLLSQAADYGEARDLAEESFDRFRHSHSVKGERVCLSLPGRFTICRTVHLPAMPEKKIEDAFRFEAQRLLPTDQGECRWRKYSPNRSDETAVRATDHLLVAITRRHIEYSEQMVERLKIQPDILQCEYLALHNFLGFELGAEEQNGDGRRGATVLLDMGAGGTNMIVHSPNYLWGRYLNVGGHTFSRALLREFQLTLQQAEQWKRDPSGVDRWSRWESTLGSVFDTFAKELTSALEIFAKDHPGERIGRILGVGGGMETHGLLRYLRTGR